MLQGGSHVSRRPISLLCNAICHVTLNVLIKVKKKSKYFELGPPVIKATFVLHCFIFETRITDSKFQIVLKEIVVILGAMQIHRITVFVSILNWKISISISLLQWQQCFTIGVTITLWNRNRNPSVLFKESTYHNLQIFRMKANTSSVIILQNIFCIL